MGKPSFGGKLKYIIVAILGVLGITGGVIAFNVSNGKIETKVQIESEYSIELSDEQVKAVIETEDGKIEVIEAPTVEAIDAGIQQDCPEGEECGMGKYIYAPTDTPIDFKNYTINKCWDTDNFPAGAKAQCWDLGDLFWQNYAGRNLNTCGTGAAKGTWEGDCKYKNAGNDFELITDPTKLQAGDWVVFNNGKWGHIGMALGGYNNGYVSLLGQNQGGAYCEIGGAAANVINISLKSFSGAFRPKSYIKPEPQPEPTPAPTPAPTTNCDRIEVKKGDTLGKIMKRCEGKIDWSKMNDYAKSWKSTKVKKYNTVYDGWVSPKGVGLFAGDVIERIK